MKEKKFVFVIILSFIFVVYAGIIIILNNNRKIPKDDSMILLFNNTDIIEYKSNNLVKASKINEDLDYYVYVNNNYFGNYQIKNDNGFKLIKNNEQVSYEGLFFAYTNNINLKVKKEIIDEVNESDLSKINSIMNYNIKSNDLIVNEKIIVDLDNNGINDYIISVSNLDAYVEHNIYFNLVYVVMNNTKEQILIKEVVKPKDVMVYPTYYVFNIFNINDSKYDYVSLQKRYYSMGGEPNSMIYEFKNNEYQKIIN